jgi:hypothetical protein
VTEFAEDGSLADQSAQEQLRTIGTQVVEFARMRAAHDAAR